MHAPDCVSRDAGIVWGFNRTRPICYSGLQVTEGSEFNVRLTRIWTWSGLGFRRRGHRARRVNALRNWGLSLVVATAALMIGLSCLPSRTARTAAAVTLADVGQGAAAPFVPAVFALRDNGAAVRFANAEPGPGGSVRIGLYDPLDPLLRHATEPVALPADARLLWLLAAPSEREAIRERAAALLVAAGGDARGLVTSDEFRLLYRDRFQAVLTAAARDAWTTTLASDAWRDLTRGMEPALREMMQREVRPVLDRRLRGVAGQMLRANALTMLDPFTDRPWNLGPIEDALRAAFQDLRERGVAERAIAHLLDQPRAAAVPALFQDEMLRRLMRDPELPRLVTDMLFDERLRPLVRDSVARANDLARTAPRLLVSLRGGQELNLVAATVIRATIAGRGDRVVVFMSPEQRDALIALDRGAVQPLTRIPTT